MNRSHRTRVCVPASFVTAAGFGIFCLGEISAAKAAPPAQTAIEVVATTLAAAGDYEIGKLRITAPWMRATPKGANVASGYMTITNTGSEPDRL
ncbi:MAG: copper chaperone PCu(A)C, partial [Hyphomicrobiales bacterium]|nr:copper chaperone PCu(A)C [Hyphomicrobiales bacterium]